MSHAKTFEISTKNAFGVSVESSTASFLMNRGERGRGVAREERGNLDYMTFASSVASHVICRIELTDWINIPKFKT